jgi:2-dehydro-3-deoxy-D-arabinonate dehydratase
MKLYRTVDGWWAEKGEEVAYLPGFDIDRWLGLEDPVGQIKRGFAELEKFKDAQLKGALPVGAQEVWAAGVTYLRSKAARMEESDFSANAYDKVYQADRPELFFKATSRRCVGDGGMLRLREDSQWMAPEPELTLVVAANQKIVGFTIGDDLSCRDIEGENLLYLPQAKVWDGCCAIGPCILINDGVEIRRSTIRMAIRRDGIITFAGATELGRIRRPFEELVQYLFRNQTFPKGVFLLTGTGIVPQEGFTLKRGDEIMMRVDEIGELWNVVE